MLHEHADIEFVPIRNSKFSLSQDYRQEWSTYLKLFLSVFLIVALVCMAYTWIRPAQYQATALLRVVDSDLTARADDTLLRDQLVLHLKRLQSPRLLTQLSENLSQEAFREDNLTSESLNKMLSASLVEGSLMIELQAFGSDRLLLQAAVQEWMDLYLIEFVSDHSDTETQQLHQLQTELNAVGERISIQRKALNEYRENHQIVSLERDESRILNRMKSLGTSLDQTVDERISAEARILAVQDGISRGKFMIRPQDQPGIDNMEMRIIELQEQLLEQQELYTPKYMRLHPKSVELQTRLEMLQNSVLTKKKQIQQQYLEEAEETLTSSREREQAIEKELASLKLQVLDFNRHYEAFSGLQRALQNLEEYEQQLKNDLVKHQVQSPQEIRFQIVERPFTQLHPLTPNYWRDSMISLGIALLFAAIAVSMRHVFTSRQRTLDEREFYPVISGSNSQKFVSHSQEMYLSHKHHTIYRRTEVDRLLSIADEPTSLAVMLLLSGIQPKELGSLSWQHFNSNCDAINIHNGTSRDINLSHPVIELCLKLRPDEEIADFPVWPSEQGKRSTVAELDALVRYAMYQAEVEQPAPAVNADGALQALRKTYFDFLIHQGPKISELEQILGELNNEEMTIYRERLPNGGIKLIDQINTNFPLSHFHGRS